MKYIGYERRAEDKANLIAGLPGFQLRNHFLSQHIALLNINLVGVEMVRQRSAASHADAKKAKK
jgi:hypothetical protein